MKSHLQSYPCPLQINSFWNLGFLLGITIILQIITGIFLGLHYTSDLNSAYFCLFFFIREIYYGWCLRYLQRSWNRMPVRLQAQRRSSIPFLLLDLCTGRSLRVKGNVNHSLSLKIYPVKISPKLISSGRLNSPSHGIFSLEAGLSVELGRGNRSISRACAQNPPMNLLWMSLLCKD